MRLEAITRRTLFGAAALALPGCWKPVYSWRQKLTIEVEANGKSYSGASVIRVSWNEAYGRQLTGRANESRMSGEAAFVEIADKGALFALLSSPHDRGDPRRAAFWALGYAPKPGFSPESFKALSRAQGRVAELSRDQYPMLVMFENIADPKTVREVDPQNLAEAFGAGVNLKRMTLEITDEPTTSKIEAKLPWLKEINGGYLHGGGSSKDAPLGLHGGNFKFGESK